MCSEANELASDNEPLCWVILIPPDGIAVVHRELMVEVVIPFTDSYKCGDKVVTRGVFVIKWRLSEVVSQTVDAECRLGVC
jgi:hypothetical protein